MTNVIDGTSAMWETVLTKHTVYCTIQIKTFTSWCYELGWVVFISENRYIETNCYLALFACIGSNDKVGNLDQLVRNYIENDSLCNRKFQDEYISIMREYQKKGCARKLTQLEYVTLISKVRCD